MANNPTPASQEPTRKEKKAKKRSLKGVTAGIVHIQATFNNTLISIADKQGNILSWSSPGKVGFSGSKKSTPFAAQVAASTAAKEARDLGLQTVDILVKGPGSGRESAIRAIQAAGLMVTSIRDVTPMPHNGCRARKKRRV
ncbi:MAG: 30S ribosomal protein S11 [Candidatus Omnitrophota bacterium]|nr:30S ribosomal protein S11 [Candidatus Omnitrophota bacterium]MDZ4242900.1 30S ribosomal protein S11 [Candidatus Omnitrophota bacterium]